MTDELFMEIKRRIGSVRRIMSELELEVLQRPMNGRSQRFIDDVRKAGHEFQVAYLEFTGNHQRNDTKKESIV